MDSNAVTRARSKAEEVRAALQREQLLAVERRKQQLGLTPSGISVVVDPKEQPPISASESGHRVSSSNVEVTEQHTKGAKSDFLSGSLGGQALGSVEKPVSLSAVETQGSPSTSPTSTKEPGPSIAQAQPSMEAKTSQSKVDNSPASTPDRQKRETGSDVMPMVGASITKQVLSSSNTSSGPRYLRYRDSLKRVSGSFDHEEMQSALKAKEQLEQVEAGNDGLKSQLVSYLDKSAIGGATVSTSIDRSEPPPSDEPPNELDANAPEGDERRYIKRDPTKSARQMAVIASLASAAASKRQVEEEEEEKEEHTAATPEELLGAVVPATIETRSPKSPKESSVDRDATPRVVSFDMDVEDTENTRQRLEDMSESESSYHGTMTLKQYRQRKALQCGVVALFFIVLPLAIGLGVAYSNRGSNSPVPSGNTTSSSAPLPASSPTPTRTSLRPVPTPAPSAESPAVSQQIITFPPHSSILDLLNNQG